MIKCVKEGQIPSINQRMCVSWPEVWPDPRAREKNELEGSGSCKVHEKLGYPDRFPFVFIQAWSFPITLVEAATR